MNKMQQQVREFHQTFGVPCLEVPTMPDDETKILRAQLIKEEFLEFVDANSKDDLIAAADAIADMAYVVIGAAVAYGIDLEPVFDEVHRSNMSKLWTFTETANHDTKGGTEILTFIQVANGTDNQRAFIAKRADGKVVKSPSYSMADILNELEKQTYAKERGE